MPIIKSAKKAARQTVKRTAKNVEIKKSIKLALKDFKKSPDAAKASKVQSEYDKAVKKGLLKKNTASRRKAAVAKLAKSVSNSPKTTAAKIPKTTKATKTAKAPKTTKTPSKPKTAPQKSA